MAGKKKMSKEVPESARKAENEFSKEQLTASARFRERRDILEALLEPGRTSTQPGAEEKIENYMKGKVK